MMHQSDFEFKVPCRERWKQKLPSANPGGRLLISDPCLYLTRFNLSFKVYAIVRYRSDKYIVKVVKAVKNVCKSLILRGKRVIQDH